MRVEDYESIHILRGITCVPVNVFSYDLYAKEDVYDMWFDGWSYRYRLPI